LLLEFVSLLSKQESLGCQVEDVTEADSFVRAGRRVGIDSSGRAGESE
jgi:hypothetical protein